MKKLLRKILSMLIPLVGAVVELYIAGYWLLIRPIRNLYLGYTMHMLTPHLLLNSFVRIFISSTVFGALWCLFDILAGFFRDEDEEES